MFASEAGERLNVEARLETAAPQGVDVCRLLVAGAGLSAGLAIPVALVLWVGSAVVGGLGARVLAMLP